MSRSSIRSTPSALLTALPFFACFSLATSSCLAQQGPPPQVQVSREPRHHKVFENAWVRVLDVHLSAGDTSLFHIHSTPSVFLVLSNTKTGSESLVEPGKPSFADGNIWFEGFYTKPRIHRVWNADTTEFHVMDMELPQAEHVSIDPPLDPASFTQLFDELPIRGYRFSIAAGASLTLPKRKAPMLLVCLNDQLSGLATKGGSWNQSPFLAHPDISKKGDFLFLPTLHELKLSNHGADSLSFALFELK